MGIFKPKTGSVILDGNPIKYSKSNLIDYWQKVNLVFQNPDSQIFFSEIYDDLAFPLRNLGLNEDVIKTRVLNAIQAVGAEDFLEKPVHFLSVGQKKRISIASILAIAPQVLLLDEPTSGLDPYSVNQIKTILQNIKDKTSIIIASHDMDLIYAMADYVYVLSKGHKLADGDKSIFNDVKLIEEANLMQPFAIKFTRNY